ncbi:MAG: ATP-dependent helicase [bacterium]
MIRQDNQIITNEKQNPYKDLLTQSQWEAVSHIEGPLLILACAGSGKTRVITYRICFLIQECGISPSQILAVTFTNKAASEMKNRVKDLIGDSVNRMWISTFHSSCVRILRHEIHHLELPNSFVIFDEDDQLRLIKKCIKEINIDEKILNPHTVLSAISRAKNNLVSVSDYREKAGNDFEHRVSELYTLYENSLRKNNALDFDDLLFMTVRVFQKKSDVLKKYQERWSYILVDEYQDTNLAQSAILDLLAAKHQNLCVVGDDDQSIYRWRGAEVRNILHFEKRYHNVRIIYLEQNYRSTKNILKVAESVIMKNLNRKGKRLWTENESGEPVSLYKAKDERDEALYVCDTIQILRKESFKDLGNFCILYRVNAQSRILEEALRQQGIPYRIVGGIRFYDRKEIKDCLAYLKLINNPEDDISLTRIINTPPRGIGKVTIDKLVSLANEMNLSIFETIGWAIDEEIFPGNILNKLETFYFLITDVKKMASESSLTNVLTFLLDETKYIFNLEKEHNEEAKVRGENVKELISATREFESQNGENSLSAFLDHVALLSDIDTYEENASAITLMTLHSAKGLEFPVVFITGMEQGIFPHSRSLKSEAELEEERRLCYVGMTRAQKRLFLSNAYERSIFGYTQRNSPSIFLNDLPMEYIHLGKIKLQSTSSVNDRLTLLGQQSALKSRTNEAKISRLQVPGTDPSGTFEIGAKVLHPQWGIGKILQIEGQDAKMKLLIDFRGHKKKLMAQYAKLQIL